MLTYSQKKKLDEIIFTIEKYKNRGAIILIAVSGEEIKTEINRELKKSLSKNYHLAQIKYDIKQLSLFNYIKDACGKKPVVYFVHNLPEIIRNEKKKNPDETPHSLKYLNFNRELFSEKKVTAIFWLDPETLWEDVQWKAPDFWVFRTITSEFISEKDRLKTIKEKVAQYKISKRDFEGEKKYLLELLNSKEVKKNIERKGDVLYDLGVLLYDYEKHDESLKNFQNALEIFKKTGQKQKQAYSSSYLGLIYQNSGDNEKALSFHQEALQLDKELGYRQGEAADLGNIGLIYQNSGEYEKALSYLKESLLIFKEIKYKKGIQGVEKILKDFKTAKV